MANQTECTNCAKAKQNGYGEIKCSFYGRKPQFDDTPCPHYSKNETSGTTECECQSDSSNARCPECGPEVSQQSSTCSTCGFPMKDDENGNTITSPNNGDTSTDGLNGTLRCPDCGQEVPQTSSTCPNCGCPLKEQENENNTTPQKDGGADTGVLKEVSWCPQCGQKVPPMSNFCPKCGCSFKEYVNSPDNTKTSPCPIPHKKNGVAKILLIVAAGLVLLAGAFFAIKTIFSDKLTQKDATYTIRIDDIFSYNCGLVTEMDVTVYECNESGATVYENNITFKADGSRDFVAHSGAKSIKVGVEIHGIDPTRLASQMYQKASGWVPMAYALNPNENTVVTMNRQTNWSNVQP